MHSKYIIRMSIIIILSQIFLIKLTAYCAASEYFVYSDNRITHSKDPNLSIKLGERLPLAALQKRFRRFKVTDAAGEDCIYCARVYGRDGSFEIHYDSSGITVTGIISSDTSSVDVFGHHIGDSVREAVGPSAVCDNGYYFECKSPRGQYLSYILSVRDGCDISIPENRKTNIPECGKIDGFILWNDGDSADNIEYKKKNEKMLTNSSSGINISDLPDGAQDVANSVLEFCLGMNYDRNQDGSVLQIVGRNSTGGRLILFQPGNICGFRDRGNGACDTDGCRFYLFVDNNKGRLFEIYTHTASDVTAYPKDDERPAIITFLVRGDDRLCGRSRQSSCAISLSWDGRRIDLKRMR